MNHTSNYKQISDTGEKIVGDVLSPEEPTTLYVKPNLNLKPAKLYTS